jgi:hypothetical protein
MTLPAELIYQSADPAPVQAGPHLIWDLGDLPANSAPGAITVIVRLALDAPCLVSLDVHTVIAGDIPEVETHNNTVTHGIYVANRQLLPFVVRR